MRCVIDIEANGLVNPDQIWVIVCKDIDTGKHYIFRNLTTNYIEKGRFVDFSKSVEYWIGHNLLGYDREVLANLVGVTFDPGAATCCDTLVISKLADYPRAGHSVENYGEEFELLKGFTLEDGTVLESKFFPQSFYMQYSRDLENYCIRDVDITHKIYLKYLRFINKKEHQSSIDLEQRFECLTKELKDNGFSFNVPKAKGLLLKVEEELKVLDEDILNTYVPRLRMVREVTPKATKHGTISLSSIPMALRDHIRDFTIGAPFCYCSWNSFNPSSHSQIIRVLNDAGWKPTDRTKTHIDTERSVNQLKYRKKDSTVQLTLDELNTKLLILKKTGWKVNENNLETLPPEAPSSARLLAKRILLESRRRTLTEWLDLVQADNRIHGRFYGIGAWTHRMSHQNPNTANIPNEFDTNGKRKLYGKELRALWQAPRNRLLVGVDAEGIQLRIFAHYINDPEFTQALVEGKKDDKTDPHSLNQRIIGSVCRTRQAAKRYIYALLLGAGTGKLREILECSERDAEEALDRILSRYTGFAKLKNEVFPKDAERGWFTGLDGRSVRIPGDTVGTRKHLAMSGYLQCGEAVVMKKATLRFSPLLPKDCCLVNFVHDEWQTETPNNMEIALRVASLQADSLRIVGEELGLLCPMAGSYWNDDLKDYTIATNWSKTH